MELVVKRDTARFDRRQWYIDGYARWFFTSEEDARDALSLARQISSNAEQDICNQIREALPR